MYQNRQNRGDDRDGGYRNRGPELQKIVSYIENGQGDLVSIFGLNGGIHTMANSDVSRTKSHQLRRFYDYLVSIDDSVKFGEKENKSEKVAKLRLIRLIPLAAYSASPSRKLLDRNLSDFIEKSAQAVSGKTGEEFREALSRFRDVYEALVAYSKG